jgi:4-hydroxymandelate oxidase
MDKAGYPINLFEFEDAARRVLDKGDFDSVVGGATDELTIARTRQVFDSILLRPRRLVDVSHRDLSTTVLSSRVSFPVMLAPSGGHQLVHPDGEVATVRAAGSAGLLTVLSVGSTRPMEEVAAAAKGPLWFQQHILKDKAIQHDLAERAKEAGFCGLCLTVDSLGFGKRERDLRNSWRPIEGQGSSVINYSPYFGGPGLKAPSQLPELIDTSATWSDAADFVAQTTLPVVIKGILTAEDARLCVESGASGIVVSAHGGRNLDTTVTSIEVLGEVVDIVAGAAEVYMDGGVRRGTDVVKALALGARAVLIGRPIFWGLAVGGAGGLRATLEILRDEIDLTMALTGKSTIGSIDKSLLMVGSVPGVPISRV